MNIDNCLYASKRKIEQRAVRLVSNNNENNDNDIINIICNQLREVYHTYSLPISRRKPDLLLHLIPFLKALNTVDNDNNDGIDGTE